MINTLYCRTGLPKIMVGMPKSIPTSAQIRPVRILPGTLLGTSGSTPMPHRPSVPVTCHSTATPVTTRPSTSTPVKSLHTASTSASATSPAIIAPVVSPHVSSTAEPFTARASTPVIGGERHISSPVIQEQNILSESLERARPETPSVRGSSELASDTTTPTTDPLEETVVSFYDGISPVFCQQS